MKEVVTKTVKLVRAIDGGTATQIQERAFELGYSYTNIFNNSKVNIPVIGAKFFFLEEIKTVDPLGVITLDRNLSYVKDYGIDLKVELHFTLDDGFDITQIKLDKFLGNEFYANVPDIYINSFEDIV